MSRVALEKKEGDQQEGAQQRGKAEVKESWYPELSGIGLQEGKFQEANDKMLHFKLSASGSIHHAHGWILLGDVSLK